MKKEDLNKAILLSNEIEELEEILAHLKNQKSQGGFGSPFIVQFTNKLTYRFPDNISFSMFDNILKSSIELELEDLKLKLEEL